MITVNVLYGNNNQYNIDLPSSYALGKLVKVLPSLINKAAKDVLYIIIAGNIVGSKQHPFTKRLDECDMINNICIAHMIFKHPNVTYPDSECYISNRNIAWLRIKPPAAAPGLVPINDVMGMELGEGGLPQFIAALGDLGLNIDISSLQDVPVVITENEYARYITQLDALTDDECAICRSSIDSIEDGVRLACEHAFHDTCLHEWLTSSSVRCPTCNHDVRE